MTHLKSPHSSRHGIVKRLSRITKPLPDDASVKMTLSDLRQELEQVEHMIRVLEWASTPPVAARH